MDILSSVAAFCSTVSETDTEYKALAKRLTYEVRKAEHLIETEKVKNVPKFMLQNLKAKIKQAKVHLQRIQKILTEDRIPFKQKLKLLLPTNKTNMIVKNAIDELQKAQNDVSGYSASSSDTQIGFKRSIDQSRKFSKKEETMVSIYQNQEISDQDLDQVLMGPTIQEDAAIEITRNKYVNFTVETLGDQKIINLIKQIDKSILVWKEKVHIKFQSSPKKDTYELELFTLGRIYFKPVYGKLKQIYADIDRISKQNHFTIKLKRKKQPLKHANKPKYKEDKPKKQQKEEKPNQKAETDEFFSFPATEEEQIVMKQIDSIVVERASDKSIYILDETGAWKKMTETEKQICRGEQIAAFIAPNKDPAIPDLFFKVHFQISE